MGRAAECLARALQVPYYNVHKIMQGLLDQHVLLGSARALDVLEGMARYFFARIQNVLATNGTAYWEQVCVCVRAVQS